jgi:hypothetical protein
MSAKKWLLIGCGGAVALLLAAIAAVVAFFWYVGQDPKGVAISAEAPSTVRLKEEFTLTITVRNERARKDLPLSDVDIAEDYLDGFLVVSTDPKPKSNMHVPLDNKRSYTFDCRIPHGDSARFTFRLRPVKTGLYRGDIDVCEGMRFLTTQVQTLVEGPE